MRVVFFTGAGVSVDSGIPCYRGEGSAPTIQLTGADWRERPEWVLQHYHTLYLKLRRPQEWRISYCLGVTYSACPGGSWQR